MPKIFLISGKAQHGKDTAARCIKQLLENKGNKVLIAHYADLVKYVCTKYFNWNGEKDIEGRTLLQRVGTDEVRGLYPDFWVKFVFDVITVFNEEWDYVIIPDCRFENEISYPKSRGFNVTAIRVERLNFISPLTQEQQEHSSETALDEYDFDYYICAEGGIENLHKKIEEVFN